MTDRAWAAQDKRPCLYHADSAVQLDSAPRWRWWLWPHLLSLDAPLVAVTWQVWWAQMSGVRLWWADSFILGFAVWMIYLADRLGDIEWATPGALLTDRHAYYLRHRTGMRCLLAAVSLSLIISTPILLPIRQFAAGLAILGVTGIYYWTIHHARRSTLPRIPKEAVVGALFSVGSGFFVAFQVSQPFDELWKGLALFGILCFLNCGLISVWEQSPQDREDASSMLNAFPRLTGALGTSTLLLAVFSLALGAFDHSTRPLPVAFSALALWLLNRCRAQLSVCVLRLLADLVLLAPWLFLGWRLAYP